jgi:hypothetical protein
MKKQYPENILRKLRQRQDLEKYDTSMDETFNAMSPNEVFEAVLEWQGFIGYSNTIKIWIEQIYGINLDEIK